MPQWAMRLVSLLCLAPLIAGLPLLPKGGVPRPNVQNNILLMGDSLVSHIAATVTLHSLRASADPHFK